MKSRGLVISLPRAILFASGEDRIDRQALPVIARIADVLRDIPNQVSLVGHADSVPIHNRHFKNNWDLSTARSLKILELLSRQYGIAESYGPYHPSGSNDTLKAAPATAALRLSSWETLPSRSHVRRGDAQSRTYS